MSIPAQGAVGAETMTAEYLAKAIVQAWDALPDGQHTMRAVERWLINDVQPVVFQARAALATPAQPAGAVPDSLRNFAAEDLARIRAVIPASLLFEVPDLAEAVASTFREYVKVAAEATALRKQVADLRTALGEPFLTAHSGDGGGSFIRLKYEALSETQAAHYALVQFFASHPAGQSAGSGVGWAEVVKAICSAVCRVEGLDPDELQQEYESEAHGWRETDPQWTRYATAVAEVLDDLPLPAPDSTRTGDEGEAEAAWKYAVETWGETWVANEIGSLAEYARLAAPALAARPAAPEAQGAWSFDMEAAPRDGTRILVTRESETCNRFVEIAAWRKDTYGKGHWALDGGFQHSWHRAVAWQHLNDPAPPASSGQGGR